MQSEQSSKVTALIVTDESGKLPAHLEALRPGGIGLLERWEKAVRDNHGVSVVTPISKLKQALETAAGPVVVAAADWVMEALAVEAAVETAAELPADTAGELTAPKVEAAPLVMLGKEAARQAAQGFTPTSGASLADSIWTLLAPFPVEKRLTKRMDVAWWGRVVDAKSADAAAWALLKRLQFRPGGLVAKYLNRPISIRMSRFLLNTSVTPNQTTWFAFFLGLVGIALIFVGGFWNTVAGALLMQANSIVDGIDGELARIRHQTSSYGAYLDSVCDEILNALLFGAMGYNLVQNGFPQFYLWQGIGIGVVSFFYACIQWHCKVKHGLGFYWWFEAYKPRREVQRSTSVFFYIKHLFWKETYLFLFVFASLFQVIHAMLWMSTPIAVLTVILFVIHIPIKRARW